MSLPDLLGELTRFGRKGSLTRTVCALLLTAAWLAAPAIAEQRFHWTDVERIVAIGDFHGDWEHYLETLRAAGLVNERGRWIGGTTHLVQTGDIPDRGPIPGGSSST